MTQRKKTFSLLTIFCLTSVIFFITTIPSFAQTPDVVTILKNIENNQIYDGFSGFGSIIIKDTFGTRKNSFNMYTKGDSYSLIEFTSAAERGQKVLRVKNKIYLYYPDAEEVITLNQSMFQRSLLDSDISYDDIAGDKSYIDLYTAEIEDGKTTDDNSYYILFLTAKDFRKVNYGYQKLWVNKLTFTIKKAEFYTRSKKLRKTLVVNKQEKVEIKKGNKTFTLYVVTDSQFFDALKKESNTQVILSSINFETLDANIFSIDSLKF